MGPQIAVSLGLGQPRVWSVALGRCEPELLRPGTGRAPERATSRRAAASTQKEHWASSGLAMHSKLLRPGTGRARVPGRGLVYRGERSPTGVVTPTVAEPPGRLRKEPTRKGGRQTFDRRNTNG